MNLQKAVTLTGIIFACTTASYAQNSLPRIGDTYVISRDAGLKFRGSHKLYKHQSAGLIEVTYCNKSYWVRYATVAWIEVESDLGYDVRVEFNRGKGWRPICNHPEKQVNLKGLGVSEDPRAVAEQGRAAIDRVSRFAAIKKTFSSDAE